MAHIKEAQRTLGSSIPWLCDGMNNDLMDAFGRRPNSEFIIDPEGAIISAREWSRPDLLRQDLARLVGPVTPRTTIADLDLQTADPPQVAPRGIVRGVERPRSMRPLITRAKAGEDGEPFYVKLRAEAEPNLTSRGRGTIYLGFHLDPIYHVHWNNLVDPVRVQITPPRGARLSRTLLEGPRVDAPTDIDPREFLVDISNARPGSTLQVEVFYFACNDEEGWCKPVSQSYDVVLTIDAYGGDAKGDPDEGGDEGARRRDEPRRRPDRRPDNDRDERLQALFEQSDTNGDGKLSRTEAPERILRVFNRFDTNRDGFITAREFQEARGGRGGG